MNSKSQLLTEAWHSRNGVPRNAACMFRSRYWSGAACITGSYISWLTFPPRQRQSYLILPARLSQDFLFVNLAFISKHLMCHYTPFNHFKKKNTSLLAFDCSEISNADLPLCRGYPFLPSWNLWSGRLQVFNLACGIQQISQYCGWELCIYYELLLFF